METTRSIVGDRLKSSRLRALGKEIVLGLNNGRSAYSISDSLTRKGFGYDLDDVQGMIMRYNMEFSGMDAWRNEIVSSAVDEGTVSTPLGRTLKVNKDTNPNSLINYPVQGTAADGFKMALIRLDDELAGYDARIVHILHDEVIVEAREDVVDSVATVVKNCMEAAFKDVLPNVPMVVEPVIRIHGDDSCVDSAKCRCTISSTRFSSHSQMALWKAISLTHLVNFFNSQIRFRTAPPLSPANQVNSKSLGRVSGIRNGVILVGTSQQSGVLLDF